MSDAPDEASSEVSTPVELPQLNPEPGVYGGVDEDRYHAAVGASASKLKLFLDAPAKAHFAGPDTATLRFGSLIHMACLQPELLDDNYYPTDLPRISKREKATQAEQAKAGKRMLVKREDWDGALRIRDAIQNHPVARDIVAPLGLQTEASFWWDDPDTGVRCRGRADILRKDWRIAADIKSCDSAHPDKVGRAIAEYGYHLSAAHYMNGLSEVWTDDPALIGTANLGPTAFWHIFVEKDPPHLIAIYEIEPKAMEIGYGRVAEALTGWAECERVGFWPGYPVKPQQVHMAGWAYAKAGMRL